MPTSLCLLYLVSAAVGHGQQAKTTQSAYTHSAGCTKPAQQKTQKVLDLIEALEDSNRNLLSVLHQDHVSFADDGIGAASVVPKFCSFCLAAARDAV